MKNLFNMSFNELCCNFNNTIGNKIPIKTNEILCTFQWENPNSSINDLLRKWIYNNGFPFFNTFGGHVWFSRDGETWESIEAVCKNNIVTYYIAK